VSRERVARRREENEVEFSRIVAFSDGVFAIAITLLVLNLNVPEHIAGDDLNEVLWDQRQDLLAYVISFAVIGRFWILHHRFFSSVIGFDARLLALNLFYLGWIALLPFSSQVLGDHGGDSAAIVLYAVNLSGTILVGMLMFADARRAGLSRMPEEEVREGRRRAVRIAAVFLASVPVAFVAPGVAQLLWLALFLDPVGRRVRRQRGG
jgi:TMEM175 potassium channel family protein